MLPASLSARWVPREFVEATRIGGALTLVAYVLMLTLFVCELRSYLGSPLSSELLLLDHEEGPLLQINLEVDMHGITCRNLDVLVMDEQGQEPIRSFEKVIHLVSLDGMGGKGQLHATIDSKDEDEERQRERQQLERAELPGELDADWKDSHDGFRHKSFEHVVKFHDYTLINFFAEWCDHCRRFARTWEETAQEIRKKKFRDRDGAVREVVPIKMNCVDFRETCRGHGVTGYPEVRLYKSDGSFSVFDSERSKSFLRAWVAESVGSEVSWTGDGRGAPAAGCKAQGLVRVPRVPGFLELTVGAGDQDLEAAMTNVSHTVRHLSFSDPRDGVFSRRAWLGLPQNVLTHVNPLDGREYCTRAFHETYEHHLRVVSTVTSSGVAYQFSHYGRTARLNASAIPQARFHFDLEPFSISVRRDGKQWYDIATSLLAILGGVFVITRLASMALLSLTSATQHAVARPATRADLPTL